LASHLFGEETEDTRLIKQAQEARVNFLKASKALQLAEKKAADLIQKVLA
jgi:hypothetical protein